MFSRVFFRSQPARSFHASSRVLNVAAKPTSLPVNGKCPKCGSKLPTPLPACSSCTYINRIPQEVTHHDVFGLPYDPNPFNVDLRLLRTRFREAQAVCHPDAWTSKGQQLELVAQDLSSDINTAYQTLLDDLPRIEYILSRNSHEIGEADSFEDMEFMSEIMDAREELDSAEAEDSPRVTQVEEDNEAKLHATVAEIEELVENKDWAAARAAAIRLRYLRGIKRAVGKWKDNFT